MNILKIGFSLIIFTLLDFLWIITNFSRYNDLVSHISGEPITINYFGVVLTYIILFIGLLGFVLPHIDNNNFKSLATSSIHYGGLFGFVIYGTYSFTNMSIFKKYNIFIAIMDTIWGTLLFILTALITKFFFK